MPVLKSLFLPLMLLGAAALGVLDVEAVLWALRPDPAWTRFCDREVTLLLDSLDPLEVRRAGLLVRQARCEVVRRIVARAP